MKHLAGKIHTRFTVRTLSVRAGLVLIALTTLVLMSAAPASASFETVQTFGGTLTAPPKPEPTEAEPEPKPIWPEEVQLGGVSAMAINRTGAGGVAPGTIYIVGYNGDWHAARYSPEGQFELGWTFDQRCGSKAGEPAHPTCPAYPGGAPLYTDIEIDQATGNVYLYNDLDPQGAVKVYSPDASTLIAQFAAPDPKGTIADSPEKFHVGSSVPSAIAVDNTGKVYLFDADQTFQHRLMIFEPKTPGDYEHYEYRGEILKDAANWTTQPVLDDAGDIYIAGEEGYIEEYDPAQPSTPVCKFELNIGGLTAMTVNPATGEPFYYTYKNRQIHQLKCNDEGKFVEKSAFPVAPVRGPITALAFDPERQYFPNRPLGTLYAATNQECPYTGNCPPEAVGRGPLGYILAGPEENPPKIVSESVANVTTTTATLRAQINPKGAATRYVFQYLTQAAYEANEPATRFAGASEAPPGGAELGEGQDTLSAAVGLSGLVPDTAYRYRVVATSHCSPTDESKVCEAVGADEAFRTYPAEAPGLADNRAWELVTPAQKHGGQVIPTNPSRSSCKSECKPGTVGEHFPQQSSPNGEAIVYMGSPFSFSEGAAVKNEYLSRRTSTGWQTTTLSPQLGGSGSRQGPVAFDAELNKGLFYQVLPSLGPEAPTDFANLYAQQTASPVALSPLLRAEPPNRPPNIGTGTFELAYAGASADLSRVFFEANDALTGETPFAPEAVDGGAKANNLYEWSAEGLRLVNVTPGNAATAPGAAFGDRSTSALQGAISADGSRAFWSSESGQVYIRENGETTREISDHAGKFLAASADGSKLLLNDGHLFELDNGEAMVDLTEGRGGFQGISGQTEDLSHVYFVDTEVLDETPNDHGDVAQEGKDNLYAWRDGTTRFIATLLPEDAGGFGTWASSPSQRSAEASPDGRWLAFISLGKPTGYDNTGAPGTCARAAGQTTGPCSEAFLYDSATGKLRCTSCNPSGEASRGGTAFPFFSQRQTILPQPRYLTNEGRLYFDTANSLSVFDTNEGVEDVYEYEPEGVGTCKREGGCVSLISAGHEAIDSNLVEADATGKNVFFTSRDQLSLRDKDDLIDLYDAREGGGIPAESEVARTECQGEACQPLYVAPNDPTPGSSSFEGAGNIDEKKAAKKHAKKHKKRHAKKKHAHKRAPRHNRGGAK